MHNHESGNFTEASEEVRGKYIEHVPDFAKDSLLVIDTFDKARPRINEESFIGIHSKEEISADIKITERLRAEFRKREEQSGTEGFLRAKETHQLATAMEVIVTQPLPWWGEAKTMRTSEYDDYINGVDAVLELPGARHIGFALDFSTSSFEEIIKQKIDRATEHVLTPGKPAEVKYYISPVTGKKESITVIPIVIGLDGKDAKKLVALVAGIIRMREQIKTNPLLKENLQKKFNDLQKHPAQMIFILEINAQLVRYQKLLESATDPRLVATRERVEDMINFIHQLGEKRAKEGVWTDDLEDDNVFAAIRKITSD